MLNLGAIAANVAQGVSAQFGAPYVPGQVVTTSDPVLDNGGSIQTPGMQTRRDCKIQIATVTESMRRSADYADGDVRALILCDTLDGALDTDATIFVADGDRTGSWLISSIERDSLNIRWEGRGRRAGDPSAYAPAGFFPRGDNGINAMLVMDLL